ncbi:MAG: hypothetical protein JW774_11145 [Candidatus Aureabacteria bacterium]|nr:hypothetical protein [Candidatus Auribacterota bacterium]
MGANKYSTLRIEYSILGEHQKGQEIFIQKNGKTYREVNILTKVLRKEYTEHTIEIDDGTYFYRINLVDKTGMKLPSINRIKRQMVENNPHLFGKGKLNPLSISPPQGLLKKTENILGRECRIYLHHNQMIYIWDEIILREINDVFGKTVKEAKKLDLNIPIEETFFSVPEGIHFFDSVQSYLPS